MLFYGGDRSGDLECYQDCSLVHMVDLNVDQYLPSLSQTEPPKKIFWQTSQPQVSICTTYIFRTIPRFTPRNISGLHWDFSNILKNVGLTNWRLQYGISTRNFLQRCHFHTSLRKTKSHKPVNLEISGEF